MVEENFEIYHLKWLKMTWNRSKIMGYFTMVEENFQIHHFKWLKMTWNRSKRMDYFTMVEENFEGEYFVFTSLHADGFSAIAARQDVVLAARGVHASGPCTPITPPLKGVHAVDLPLQGRPFQTGERVCSESRYICKQNLLSLKCILNAYLGGRVYGNWRKMPLWNKNNEPQLKLTGSYKRKKVYIQTR